MNLLRSLLKWRKPARSRAAVTLPARPVLQDDDDGGSDDGRRCCGWFDSSHELQHGLSVREHATPDTLAGELPLASWLELHLAGWRAELPA